MEWINKRFSKDPKAVFRISDEQAMVIYLDDKPVGRDQIYIFNSTGTKCWELLDGNRNIGEIVKKMCNEFEVDYKEAEKEIIEFTSDLLKKHLIICLNK